MMLDFIHKNKDHYILDENNNVVPATLYEWGYWFNADVKRRIVQQDYIQDKFVSTVFIGIDHNFKSYFERDEVYKPHIFETIVFGGIDYREEIFLRRYSTWDEALKGHLNLLKWVEKGCK